VARQGRGRDGALLDQVVEMLAKGHIAGALLESVELFSE